MSELPFQWPVQSGSIEDPDDTRPYFQTSPVTSATGGLSYGYSVVVKDPDGDPITLSAPVLPSFLSFKDNGDGTGVLSGTLPDETSSHSITLRAFANEKVRDQSFTLRIEASESSSETSRPSNIRMLLSKIYRDLRLNDTSYDLDFIEWIGEALAHIGAFPQLERKMSILEVTSHKTTLPGVLVQLEAVAYAKDATADDIKEHTKRFLPMSSATFHAGLHADAFTESELGEESYTISGNLLTTSFEDGVVVISYLAYPLDEEGFPVVPDDPSTFEACKWYCVTRMMEGGWQHPAGLTYMQVEERWLKYCSQSRTGMLVPDMAETERIMDAWVRMIPDHDAPYRFFTRGQKSNETKFGTKHLDLDLL